MQNLGRLRRFVEGMTRLLDHPATDELTILREGGVMLTELVQQDDWLPEAFTRPLIAHYVEYLLYCDPHERFCVVSCVLAPGQKTPVHNHTTWCLSGVLRGLERYEEYRHEGVGVPMRKIDAHTISAGEIDAVSPTVGDIHAITNVQHDKPSVSVRVFGNNIGMVRRNRYTLATGEVQEYVTGYCNEVMPNLWGMGPGLQNGGVPWSYE